MLIELSRCGAPLNSIKRDSAKLLARHRHLETLFRGDQVIVIVFLQIDLHPVHFAAELIVFWVIVSCNGRTGSLSDIAGLVCREYHRYCCIYRSEERRVGKE